MHQSHKMMMLHKRRKNQLEKRLNSPKKLRKRKRKRNNRLKELKFQLSNKVTLSKFSNNLVISRNGDNNFQEHDFSQSILLSVNLSDIIK